MCRTAFHALASTKCCSIDVANNLPFELSDAYAAHVFGNEINELSGDWEKISEF